MTRDPNWPKLLTCFVEERRGVPFAWGGQDCCLFAADWVLLCTGEDPAAAYRGTYSSLLGAMRHIKAAGGVRQMPLQAGLTTIAPAMARRGDLVAEVTPLGLALGVCLGRHHTFPGRTGLIFHHRHAVLDAWRV